VTGNYVIIYNQTIYCSLYIYGCMHLEFELSTLCFDQTLLCFQRDEKKTSFKYTHVHGDIIFQ